MLYFYPRKKVNGKLEIQRLTGSVNGNVILDFFEQKRVEVKIVKTNAMMAHHI